MEEKKKSKSVTAKNTKRVIKPKIVKQEEFKRPERLTDAYSTITFKHNPEGEPKATPIVNRADLKRAFVLKELLFSKPLALRRGK